MIVTAVRRLLTALAALTALTALPVAAQVDAAKVDSFIAAAIKERNLVGVQVGIMQDGRIAFARGYGEASIPGAIPVDTTTRFAIGSVTKQFTCAIILQLAAEGKLSVNDPVSKYFKGLTRADEITLLDLMNHVSGYPDYYPLDFLDLEFPARAVAVSRDVAMGAHLDQFFGRNAQHLCGFFQIDELAGHGGLPVASQPALRR